MKKHPQVRRTMLFFCILCQAKIKAVKVSASAVKLAEKESKRKEKEDSKRKSINKPSSAKKPCLTKASAHIIRELRHLAAFQAQLILFTKVDKTKKLQRWALIEEYFHGNEKRGLWECARRWLLVKVPSALFIIW
jgi:hypothetical protein